MKNLKAPPPKEGIAVCRWCMHAVLTTHGVINTHMNVQGKKCPGSGKLVAG